jgi:hypothetical protein
MNRIIYRNKDNIKLKNNEHDLPMKQVEAMHIFYREEISDAPAKGIRKIQRFSGFTSTRSNPIRCRVGLIVLFKSIRFNHEIVQK